MGVYFVLNNRSLDVENVLYLFNRKFISSFNYFVLILRLIVLYNNGEMVGQ